MFEVHNATSLRGDRVTKTRHSIDSLDSILELETAHVQTGRTERWIFHDDQQLEDENLKISETVFFLNSFFQMIKNWDCNGLQPKRMQCKF